MWFTLSKLLGYLLSPLPFTLALVGIGIIAGFAGARRLSRFMVVTGMVLLYICSMPLVDVPLPCILCVSSPYTSEIHDRYSDLITRKCPPSGLPYQRSMFFRSFARTAADAIIFL